jgi:hypothetical protein
MSNVAFFVIGLLVFVGTIVTLIVFFSGKYNNKISRRRFSRVEGVIIAGILIGTVGMFQPVSVDAYKFGFLVLLLSTLAYVVWSHVVPRSAVEEEE